MRVHKLLKKTSNNKVYRYLKRRIDLSCSYCPPHRGENYGRWARHGTQKPKYKNKRRLKDCW